MDVKYEKYSIKWKRWLEEFADHVDKIFKIQDFNFLNFLENNQSFKRFKNIECHHRLSQCCILKCQTNCVSIENWFWYLKFTRLGYLFLLHVMYWHLLLPKSKPIKVLKICNQLWLWMTMKIFINNICHLSKIFWLFYIITIRNMSLVNCAFQ